MQKKYPLLVLLFLGLFAILLIGNVLADDSGQDKSNDNSGNPAGADEAYCSGELGGVWDSATGRCITPTETPGSTDNSDQACINNGGQVDSTTGQCITPTETPWSQESKQDWEQSCIAAGGSASVDCSDQAFRQNCINADGHVDSSGQVCGLYSATETPESQTSEPPVSTQMQTCKNEGGQWDYSVQACYIPETTETPATETPSTTETTPESVSGQACTASGGQWDSSTRTCTQSEQGCIDSGGQWYNGWGCDISPMETPTGTPDQACTDNGGEWDPASGKCILATTGTQMKRTAPDIQDAPKTEADKAAVIASFGLQPANPAAVTSKTAQILANLPQDVKTEIKAGINDKNSAIGQTPVIPAPPSSGNTNDQQGYISKGWDWITWGGSKTKAVYNAAGENAPEVSTNLKTADTGTKIIKDTTQIVKSFNTVNDEVASGQITQSQGKLLKVGYGLGKAIKWTASYVPIVGDTVGKVADGAFSTSMKTGEKWAKETTRTNNCIDDWENC